MQHHALSLIISLACLGLTPLANAQAADPAVKKSDSGICHDKSSTSYAVTKKFEAFANMDACLKSGGRAPANAAAPEPVMELVMERAGERATEGVGEVLVSSMAVLRVSPSLFLFL